MRGGLPFVKVGTASGLPRINDLHAGFSESLTVTCSQRHAVHTCDRCNLRIKIIDRPTKTAPASDNCRELASGKAVERKDAVSEQRENTLCSGFEITLAPTVRQDGDAVDNLSF